MLTKLELYPPSVPVESPIVGEIYAANLEESWNRVKVLNISAEKNEASVLLIDIGTNEVVKTSQLFTLQSIFFSVAPQVLHNLSLSSTPQL